MDLSVVIVDYRTPAGLLKRCRKSVAKFCSEAHVVEHDNARQNENLGALWNRLVRQTSTEFVLILNPDAELTDGCLAEMFAGMEYRRRIGAVGPCGNVRTVQSSADPQNAPRFVVVDDLSGFCVLIRREAFDAVGGFREDYPLYGSDTDLFTRMRRFGWGLVWATDAYCEHEGGACVNQAVLHGELESEEAARLEGQKYYMRHGVAVPEVLQFAADYIDENGGYEVRSNYDLRDLELQLAEHLETPPRVLGDATIDRELRTLVWYSQDMPVEEARIKADARAFRWAIVFEDERTFAERDLGEMLKRHWENVHLETLAGQRVAICALRRQTVCLTVLAKNEGKTIERAIRSYPWDKIVVGIDNKTDDDTAAVVKRLAVKEVWRYDFPTIETLEKLKADGVPAKEWEKHTGFAPLRNESLRRSADCDWMIFLDGHEFLDPRSATYLEHILTFHSPRGRVGLVTVIHGGQHFQYTRMMRPASGVHFSGVFHNDVEGYDDSTAALFAPVRLIHDRPDPVTENRKQQVKSMNRYYFEALLEDDPEDERALFYLGGAYKSGGEDGKAVETWSRYIAVPDAAEKAADGEGYIPYNPQKYQASLYLGAMALRRGDLPEAWRRAMGCWLWDSARNEHLIMLGDVAMHLERYPEAENWYRLAAQYKQPASVMFVKRRCYGALPWISLARAVFRMGRAKDSMEAIGTALSRDPGDREALGLLAAIQRATGPTNGDDGNVEAVAGGRNLALYEEAG